MKQPGGLLVWSAAAVSTIGHKTRHNQPLNLLRAFVNLENFGVAHQLFHGVPGKMLQKVSAGSAGRAVLAVEAVATKNLKSMRVLGISERGLGFCSFICKGTWTASSAHFIAWSPA